MPKQKTHKGIKKVLKLRAGKSIPIGKPGARHNTGKKSSKSNRSNRKGSTLSSADKRRLKSLI